ncbi:MAG TPA: hypothetical protein VME19_02465 [Streptosporangiaceae bacterium]|nr:hypothetical protein [Streptosporangiaceae bacterium]
MARLLITSAAVALPDAIPARDEADRGGSARRSARRWGLLLVAGWLVQALIRAWFSRMQVVPLANPDESAYLIAARVLAGGHGADFSGSTLYQAGYPLLITPVYWFTHNPAVVYHAVLLINAAVSALLMPLAYAAGRRLGLGRPAAYGASALTATVPAGLFYSEYAMADAIFPVVVVAWMLSVHGWLTAGSARGRYAAAVGSALLAGYAYSIHPRGLVIVIAYGAVGLLIAWRRLAPRWTAVAAAATLLAAVGVAWWLNSYLAAAMYPGGTRSLGEEMASRMANVHGAINVLEMATGQMWRLVLDGWGIAGLGLVAATAVVVRRGIRVEARIMAALAVSVTVLTAFTAPAALPPDQSQTWASGRYLDGMIVMFFLVGIVVLLRASRRHILLGAAGVAAGTVLAAVVVAAYAGSSLPTNGFGYSFNFAEPAVLTQNWNQASVALATAVVLALLGVAVLAVLAARRWGAAVLTVFAGRRWRVTVPAALAAPVSLASLAGGLGFAAIMTVNLVALTQMTSNISQANTAPEVAQTTGLVAAAGLKPGDRIAVASDVSWELWEPLAFEVPWTSLEFFNPNSAPPADATVVEVPWPADGQGAQAIQPKAPAGWRIAGENQSAGWIAWRRA